jgi:hypothetical protein
MTTSSNLVFCCLCNKLTPPKHERQHRQSTSAPSLPPTTSSSTFYVVTSGSESESESCSDASSAPAPSPGNDTHLYDNIQDLSHEDSPPVDPDMYNRWLQIHDPYEWLHNNFPTAEIYDSDCGEDRETWMKRHEPPPGVSIEASERKVRFSPVQHKKSRTLN